MTISHNTRKKVTDMTPEQAKSFFLKKSSYISMSLPAYFSFHDCLEQAKKILNQYKLEELSTSRNALSKQNDVNYKILINKDGNYSWRPLQIIHPIGLSQVFVGSSFRFPNTAHFVNEFVLLLFEIMIRPSIK
ncbi:MAG: hypothetical protein LKI80_04840 [Sporolactobacillus sp.]|nr:hypothetical protein [Sporolactobacillus sp.]